MKLSTWNHGLVLDLFILGWKYWGYSISEGMGLQYHNPKMWMPGKKILSFWDPCTLTNKSVDFLPHFGAIPHMWCGKGEFEACSSLLPDYFSRNSIKSAEIYRIYIFSKWSNISSRICQGLVTFPLPGMFWRSPLDGCTEVFGEDFPLFWFGERNSHTFFGTEVVMVSMVCFRESAPQSGSWHF